MSQQPPPGPSEPEQSSPYQGPSGGYPQQPQQPQPQQPYAPYGQAPYGQPYPNPYAGMPQQPKSHTTRNVLLILGAVMLLFCGGLVALVVLLVNNVDDAFESDYRGSENDPITVAEGEAFEIRGFDYDEGWAIDGVAADDLGNVISGLRATNDRDDEDTETPRLTFTLLRGNEVLGEISCNANAAVRYERQVALDCTTYGTEIPQGYDTIEVYDTSFYE